MTLSRAELERLTAESIDPTGFHPISATGQYENVNLPDEQLVQMIEKRNKEGQPTFKLRFEYTRRLEQRGL